MIKVAVVILNWNGKRYLEKYLGLLIERTTVEGAQIIIADNASTDGSQEWLKEHYPNITLIEFSENWGYTGGYNRALKQVEAEYFLLLNSDIEVTEGWLEPLVAAMDSNPKVGISMPKMKSLYEREMFEYAGACGGFIDYFGFPFCRGRVISHLEKDEGQYDTDIEIFWASGAAFMIRASLFRELGGFDDSFFAHMEEIDLCWRAKLNGSEVWIFPKSEVYHVGGGTLPNDSPRKLYFNYRNNLLMLYKNLPRKRLAIIMTIRMLMDGASALLYLLQGKRGFYRSVVKAHKDFRKTKKEIKRDEAICNRKITSIYRGSILLRFFLIEKKAPPVKF